MNSVAADRASYKAALAASSGAATRLRSFARATGCDPLELSIDGGHSLDLVQGVVFGIVDHVATQLVPRMQHDPQSRQNGQQNKDYQTFTNGTKKKKLHCTP